ncbi:MAG TPA: redoxin family protein [Flavobacterium sp.]|uniref:redoxin family protein n=1 Tax=unclassified Flavobacterium TaxID=196869 RepID=UPI0025C15597|nr:MULTISPECIES: redoxin family protein [unclassified Flavobacterium]HRE78912.1 redoxin family protein [Flavobacterium sp.]
MKNSINNLFTAIQAEHIKKRGTGLYSLSFIFGLIIPLLYTIVVVLNPEPSKPIAFSFNIFTKHLDDILDSFTVFIFPLLIILITSKIAQLDHKNGGWQLMETTPLQKTSIYLSKFCIVLIANIIAISTFLFFSVISTYLIYLFTEAPEVADFSIPVTYLLHIFIRLFIASLYLTAFQYFLAVKISSYIWSVLIGFFLLIGFLIISNLVTIPDWFPFEILNRVSKYPEGSQVGNWFLFTEKNSLIGTAFFLFLGYYWYSFKSIFRAFFSTKKRVLLSLFVLLITLFSYLFLSQTHQVKLNDKTIIAGEIKSDIQFGKAYLIHPIIEDTLAALEIKNNKFHTVLSNKIPLDNYKIIIDNSLPVDLLFASNDSIFASIEFKNNELKTELFGTRFPENDYKKSNSISWSYLSYQINENVNLDNSKRIQEELYDEWEEKFNAANTFRTADNYTPKQDFIEKEKKLITVEYLNLLNQFLDKRKALFPNEKTVLTDDIASLKSKISLQDETLIGNENYLIYLLYELTKNDDRDIDKNLKEIDAISTLEPSQFKNRLLFYYLKNNIKEANSSENRLQLVENYANKITDSKLNKSILHLFKTYERLGRGKIADEILATNLDSKPISLANFKGKYVVIDVWATWCGPCLFQSPYFEKMAIKYKKENIQFIALSTDKDITKWYVSAKLKSKSVLQLHANDMEKLRKDYNIESIPRFILIDTDGKIYNSNMPFPTEPAFEMILRKVLNLKEME